jgi:sarcosine oxidase
MGSSHGISRIIRLPYYEDPAYVALLYRAYELWHDIEAVTGQTVLVTTGSLDGGPEDGEVFQGALRSARLHKMDHTVLTGAEVNARFPGYRLPAAHRLILQPKGGLIASERAIIAHVNAAQAEGAHIHARERVLGWEARPGGEGVTVTTEKSRYEAARLVITAGAWMGELAAPLRGLAIAERQVLAWLQPLRPELFTTERFPVFNLSVEEGRYYGFPVYEVPGFKFGRYHHLEETGAPDDLRRDPDAADETLLRAFGERYFPEGSGATMALRSCMFTNTPDEHFVLDKHPEYSQVVLASPCSGHGYKFCSVIGEILADLAIKGETQHDIGFLRLNRAGLNP